MRSKKLWSPLCLLLGIAATAGCASLPGVTSLMPGAAAKSNQTWDAQLSMARLSERQGDVRTAEQIYQAVLTTQPQNPLALHRLGVLSAKVGEQDKAAEYFNAAAQAGPPSAELLNDIGFNLIGMGRVQEGEAVIRQAIAADPQNRAARNNLGLVLGETGRYDESLAEFRRGGKGEAEAQANLAYAQTQAGDVAGAKSSYHRALTLDNELKPAAEGLIQLARQPSPAGDPDQVEPGQTAVSRAFGQRHRKGASAPEPKTLLELVREGRNSDFFESVTERDRATGRAKTVRFSGETTDAVRQAAYIQDAAAAGEHDSYPLMASKPDRTETRTALIQAVTNRPSPVNASVSGRSSPNTQAAVDAGGSFVLSRVFRFPTRVESTPTTEIHRRAPADAPAPNSAGRAARRLSADLPNPATLADAVIPPPARPTRRRRATLHQPATNASPVAPFETSVTRATDHPPARQSAAQTPPSAGPAPGSNAAFAAPALFLSSSAGTAAPSPWQTPTWTPDFGAALSAAATAPAPPQQGAVIPASPLANLAP